MSAMLATKPPIQPAFRYIIDKILALLDNMQVKNSWGAISLRVGTCADEAIRTSDTVYGYSDAKA